MKQAIFSPDAPRAMGAYSQAIRGAGMVFVSGQVALDPATGKLIEGDVAAQTERVMKNLAAILATVGSGLKQELKSTVYLTNMDDFVAMNEVYGKHMGSPTPARSTVAVSQLPDKGALVEIDVIALL